MLLNMIIYLQTISFPNPAQHLDIGGREGLLVAGYAQVGWGK